MRFMCNNNILFPSIYKRFCYNFGQYTIRIPILIMLRNQNNSFVSETESNEHGNTDHYRTYGNNIVSHIHDNRRSRRERRFQESINATHSINNFNDLLINPYSYVFQQYNNINGFNPSMYPIPHQHFSTSSSASVNYAQHNNYVSFRRGDTKSPQKKFNSNTELRKWKNTKLGAIISPVGHNKKPGMFFSIMNYNVLAQDLLVQHSELYNKNVRNALKWEFRWKNLLNEIMEHSCDILCLQEVQESHIATHYDRLKTLGYDGLYKQATGIKTDGCAIYYKRDMFKLIEYITVEYMQRDTNLLNRDNIALIAKFAPLTNLSAEFIVATTHLLYNPKREDVRLAQSQVLLTEVERMAFNPSKGNYLPIIITGDLNSTPETTVYELFTTGSTNYTRVLKSKHSTVWISPQLSITDNCEHANLLEYRQRNQTLNRYEEFQVIKLQHSEKRIIAKNNSKSIHSNIPGKINHNFNFKSVYENCMDEGTTYQDKWVIVDYIFYSAKKFGNKLKDDNLVLLSYYALPKGNGLKSLIIPNEKLGSDHLSLIAKFKLEY